jgi:hypothetical protein
MLDALRETTDLVASQRERDRVLPTELSRLLVAHPEDRIAKRDLEGFAAQVAEKRRVLAAREAGDGALAERGEGFGALSLPPRGIARAVTLVGAELLGDLRPGRGS